MVVAPLFALACQFGLDPATSTPSAARADEVAAPARMHRLTDAMWRNTVEDLTGVRYAGDLPPDYVLHGFSTVGASEATYSPVELEELEAAAWSVAGSLLHDAAAREAWMGCASSLGRADLADESACLRGRLADLATRAWRRPLEVPELDALVALHDQVEATVGDATTASRAAVAAILLSPELGFRVEVGEWDRERGVRRYTNHEMAARLAFALTAAGPDAELLQAADEGRLTTDAGVREHAERLLADHRATEALTAFFAEWMDLRRLDTVDKDLGLFPQWGDALRATMAEEVDRLFVDVGLDGDLRDLLVTDLAWVDPTLADIYGVTAPEADLTRVRLPPDQARGGLLGRAAFLTLNAHATLTSPTLRGKAVRTRLLCQDVPPPPPGVSTSLEGVVAEGSLRDRLEVHMTDPTCAGCHSLMDPVGFAFEHFDPIGQWRADDGGYAIDTSSELDGVAVAGASELASALAAHPALAACAVRQVTRYTSGQLETTASLPSLDDLAAAAPTLAVRELALAVVTHPVFRDAAPADLLPCLESEEGESRACSSSCGEGFEVCLGGSWQGCTAAEPGVESCDADDDDCDGLVDEVVRACDAGGGLGLQSCAGGAWSSCVGAPTALETCNGLDDDVDGTVDEATAVDLRVLDHATLTAGHASCDAATDPWSPACHAATNRICAATGCGVSGYSPVDLDAERVAGVCLDATQVEVVSTTFTELAVWHAPCDGVTERQGPNCNAAIHRFCAASGRASGFGPVENSGDAATVVCTPLAKVLDTTYTALATFESSCDGAVTREGVACNEAFHLWCRDGGFKSGFGPLENSGDLAYAACVGVREDL